MKLFCLCLMLAFSWPSFAKPVDLQLANGIGARAEFDVGNIDKPVVIILHGFLQTYESPSIFHLSASLKDLGYTVLTPNLSLNITNRRQSLACEAIHTHTMDEDIHEIDAWVNWLMHKRPSKIILIGHSFGSLHALAYLHFRPNAPISKYIGISLIEAQSALDDKGRTALIDSLKKRIQRGDTSLVSEPLSYCHKYIATPDSLASYLAWSPQHILETIKSLTVPRVFIMGGNDERLGPYWTEQLKATPSRVITIAGANHFMDGEHEFDLNDAILTELKLVNAE